MSQQLIDRSDDLRHLQNDGFDISIVNGYLLLQLPYVNSNCEIKYDGLLISALELSGDITVKPSSHVALFAGDHPCDKFGRSLNELGSSSNNTMIKEGLSTNFQFSARPPNGYANYFHKMDTYASMISGPAVALDKNVKMRPHKLIVPDAVDDSIFNYTDNASSRAGINMITNKLKQNKIAIIGLGGTGSYVLDLVAKTPVREIHLFDGDNFEQHNAFRSPGAPSPGILKRKFKKVTYFKNLYSRMRCGIIPHPYFMTQEHLDCLQGMDFVFICIDVGKAKRPIVEWLEENNIPFIDVGMGLYEADGKLGGLLRVTTSTPKCKGHCHKRIDMTSEEGDGVYEQNIQIADMNSLNAALAVIRWKKHAEFYHDLEHEHFTVYTIDGNNLTNKER